MSQEHAAGAEHDKHDKHDKHHKHDQHEAAAAKTGQIFERHVFVCTGGKYCPEVDGDGWGVHARMKKAVAEAGLGGRVRVNQSGCLDQCGFGPMMVIYPDSVWYWGVRPEDVDEIVREHLVGGRPVERLIYRNRPGKNKLPRDERNRPVGRPHRKRAKPAASAKPVE